VRIVDVVRLVTCKPDRALDADDARVGCDLVSGSSALHGPSQQGSTAARLRGEAQPGQRLRSVASPKDHRTAGHAVSWLDLSDTGRPRVGGQLVPMAPLSGRAGARLTTRRTHAVKLRRGRLLLRRLEPKGGRIPWPVRSCPSSSSGGASVTVVGRRCSPIGVQKRRLGVDLDGGCSRNPLGERQRDQRGGSGCRCSSDPRELEQRLGLGRA
jgi:hypothetical protein